MLDSRKSKEGSISTRSLKVQGVLVRVSHRLLEGGHTGIEGKGGELVPPNASSGQHGILGAVRPARETGLD